MSDAETSTQAVNKNKKHRKDKRTLLLLPSLVFVFYDKNFVAWDTDDIDQ